MNIRKILLACAIPLLLATGNSWGEANCEHSDSWQCGGSAAKAPEIDASSGVGAIALLTGVVLLMKEKIRSRRDNRQNKNHMDRP